MATLVPVIDMSFDPLTVAEIDCLRDQHGARVMVQCLWTGIEQPAPRVTNLRLAHNSGMLIAGYASLNASNAGIYHMAKARAGIPNDLWDAMLFVAPDVELPAIKKSDVKQSFEWLRTQGKANLEVLYTSFNAWRNLLVHDIGDDFFRDILLWNAYWDLVGDIDFPRLPFGPWTESQVIIEQYSGGTIVCGQNIDRNSAVAELLIPPEETDMNTEERERLERAERNIRDVTNLLAASVTSLNQKAIHVNNRVNNLVSTTNALQAAIAHHFQTHNTGGGTNERLGQPLLDTLRTLQEQAERERDSAIRDTDEIRELLDELKRREEPL